MGETEDRWTNTAPEREALVGLGLQAMDGAQLGGEQKEIYHWVKER